MGEKMGGPGSNIDLAAPCKSTRVFRLNRSDLTDKYYSSLATQLEQRGFGKGLRINWFDEYDSRTYNGTLSGYNTRTQAYVLQHKTEDSEITMHVTALQRYADSQK